jgi:hypothetical protein
VVAEDQPDVDSHVAAAVCEQQGVEYVAGLRDKHERPHGASDLVDLDLGIEQVPYGLELGFEVGPYRQGHLDSHEECLGVGRVELHRLRDVAAGRDDGSAHRVHDARPIGAAQRDHPMRLSRHRGRVSPHRRGRRATRKW